ncbi:cytochrome c-type biogenesis protein CcsB [Kitasatospora sp. SolWspMP-SS2h]|uniref:c-type cytochrome biogenesis protein CcsB n=1 Tax=Kitasatospora sp. SolWspMP-SS2h TaxID=1305729 RepID=UPI000DC0189A|nr:c-type cytochrome biogenesis protein CcsB [Kitasatospora sp. SolWspMP-SS2h]RAJ35355.1 cytochrome c-type biogenesis protein CcsB [Kitasatospora sp. SolWspMP-SS2h]
MLLAQVDTQLANLSNYLIYSAMTVYTLAMFAQIFEWTFGAKGGVAVRSAQQSTLAETVADAADAAKGVRKVTVTVAAQGGGTTTLTRTALADAGATTVTSGRGDDAPADGTGPAGTSEKADLAGRIAVSLTVLGLLLHAGSVITRGLSVMRWPWGNMYEFSCAFALMMVGAYVILLVAGKNVRWLGLPVTVVALLILGIAVSVLYTDSEQLVPALHSYWLGIHVSTATICGGAFFAAFVATATYLLKDRYEHRVAAGLTVRAASLMERLPASGTLDKLSYRINAVIFPLWTFTIIAGAIWAEAAWGKYWEWDPKETWSFITWVAYAAYLHARATAGWRGRKAAYLALLAFACWLFNFYGVNIFITGKHSYAGV